MAIARHLKIAASGYYHVFTRGVEKRPIFLTDSDRVRFRHNLEHYCAAHNVKILAYCLMPNHFHLILHTESIDHLSKALHRILTGYTMYFNRKYDRVGHLFQNRFQSKAIETDTYLATLVAYLRANPRTPDDPWLSLPAQ